jgi:hypothetical protein
MGALFGGLAQKGRAPAGPPGGRYFSVPGEVSEAESLWELWVPLAGDPPEAPAEGIGLGVRRNRLEAILHASLFKTPSEQRSYPAAERA